MEHDYSECVKQNVTKVGFIKKSTFSRLHFLPNWIVLLGFLNYQLINHKLRDRRQTSL